MATAPHSDPWEGDLQLAFAECRPVVLSMLAVKYPGVSEDHEDIYQETWLEALESRGPEFVADDPRQFLKTIAWRRARDRLRNGHTIAADPHGPLFLDEVDVGEAPDDVVQVSVDAAVVLRVVEELDERRAAAIKMRFGLGMSSVEIEEALGVNRRRLDKIFRTAYRSVEKELTADGSGESPWSRRQRSLLHSCLTGLATDEQRARAQELVDSDPACRAMLAEMRATLDKVAAVLPMPVLAEFQAEHSIPLLDQLQQGGASLRDAVTSGAGRAGGQAATFEPVASGGLASVSAAGAAKVVLVCLSLGGGAAACIEVGVLGTDPKPENAQAKEYEPKKPAKDERAAVVAPRPTPTPRPTPAPKKRTVAPKSSPVSASTQPVPKTNGAPPPSPAPAGSVEFGPGSVGSTGASKQPAAAPADGGGEFTP